MEEIYVGKRVYYINRYYKAVFAKIVEIKISKLVIRLIESPIINIATKIIIISLFLNMFY